MRRSRRSLVLAAMLVSTALIPQGEALGQEPIGGYVMRSTAAPVAIVFNSPSTGIPASPTGELSVARTSTSADSGPSGYGLASLLWPGDTAASAGPAATGEFKAQWKENGGPPEWADRIPDGPLYPVRAETFHPQGPDQQESGAQGVAMTSRSRENDNEALARVSGVIIPAIASASSVESFSRSTVKDGVAISESISTVRDLSILGGVIRAKELKSSAIVTSDGVEATVTGTFHAADFSIAAEQVQVNDQGIEGTIDEDTVRVLGATLPVKPADLIAQATKPLEQEGISVVLAEPMETRNGAEGSRAFDGLIVTFKAGALERYVSRLPDEVEEEFRKQVALDQVLTIAIGSVYASANAVPLYVPPPFQPPVFPPPSFVPPTFTPPTFDPVQTPVNGGGEGPIPPVATVGLDPRPVAAVAVPVGLAVLVVAFALFGSAGAARLADRATAPGVGIGCGPEDR